MLIAKAPWHRLRSAIGVSQDLPASRWLEGSNSHSRSRDGHFPVIAVFLPQAQDIPSNVKVFAYLVQADSTILSNMIAASPDADS